MKDEMVSLIHRRISCCVRLLTKCWLILYVLRCLGNGFRLNLEQQVNFCLLQQLDYLLLISMHDRNLELQCNNLLVCRNKSEFSIAR